MTALSPGQAIAYLRALSCDVRAVGVHAPDGALLAGEAVPSGDVVRARVGVHEIVLALGPHALAALAAHDAQRAAAALGRPADKT